MSDNSDKPEPMLGGYRFGVLLPELGAHWVLWRRAKSGGTCYPIAWYDREFDALTSAQLRNRAAHAEETGSQDKPEDQSEQGRGGNDGRPAAKLQAVAS